MAYVQHGEVVLRGRRDSGLPPDITHRFPEIQVQIKGDLDIILDGELVVMKDGKPDFNSIQQRNTDNKLSIRVLSKSMPAEYHVFDAIPLVSSPYSVRQQMLRDWLLETDRVRIVPSFTNGERLFQEVVDRGMEGIMAKSIDSPYTPGVRSSAWQKIKPLKTETFWAVGLTQPTGSRTGFGAVILAEEVRYRTSEQPDSDVALRYVGCVGSGFSEKDLADWSKRAAATCPFETDPKLSTPVLRWIRPEPIRVSYFERTTDGLRFPRVAAVA